MLVVHDPLCPLTPAAFIEQAIEESRGDGMRWWSAYARSPTRSRSTTANGSAPPIDRDDLMSVTSPVVLPATVVAALDELATDDLAGLRGPAGPALPGALPARAPARAADRRRGRPRGARRAQLDRVISASASATSSAKVTFRLAAVLGTPATTMSAYRSRQAAVSVPTNPSAVGLAVGAEQRPRPRTPAVSVRRPARRWPPSRRAGRAVGSAPPGSPHRARRRRRSPPATATPARAAGPRRGSRPPRSRPPRSPRPGCAAPATPSRAGGRRRPPPTGRGRRGAGRPPR